jgi:ABC-type dipeptide/oligopeptide/nickel transport system permease component
MLKFIVQRLLYIALVYVLIVFFVHLGMRMAYAGGRSVPLWQAQDRPGRAGRLIRYGERAWQDTLNTLRRVAKGDLGQVRTAAGLVPINQMVGEAYLNSVGLLLVSLVFATVCGLLIGVIAALAIGGTRGAQRVSWTRSALQRTTAQALLFLTMLGVSTPAFFAGLLLQLGELQYLDLFGRRLVRMAGFGWDFEHMLMPVLVLSTRPLAYLTRATFLALRQALQEDYMRTAFAKGLSLPYSVAMHAARNAAVPVLTAIGVAVRFSLGALPVVEFFFAWPGLGRQLLTSIGAQQSSTVIALASVLGLTFLLANMVLDIAFRVLDPRVSFEGETPAEERS